MAQKVIIRGRRSLLEARRLATAEGVPNTLRVEARAAIIRYEERHAGQVMQRAIDWIGYELGDVRQLRGQIQRSMVRVDKLKNRVDLVLRILWFLNFTEELEAGDIVPIDWARAQRAGGRS